MEIGDASIKRIVLGRTNPNVPHVRVRLSASHEGGFLPVLLHGHGDQAPLVPGGSLDIPRVEYERLTALGVALEEVKP